MCAKFNIPVAVFMFKRAEKTAMIIDQIAKVAPSKIYLIGDGPRNKEEEEAVLNCRKNVEEHITWDCEIIRNYASQNRGVYQNIAGGAKWVFEREEMAIFLEDDNFPSLSFFPYCQELLEKYKNDSRVLWVCGTNYMQQYTPEDGSDYVFTQLMLPCGWASWATKFNTFYDGEMQLFQDLHIKKNISRAYHNRALYNHDLLTWERSACDIAKGRQPISWDYQMAFSLRVHNLYGIAPKVNLIRNIGVDMDSIHGGNSMNKVMTARFCEVPIYEMEFPLRHPVTLLVDQGFENRTEKIILPPFLSRAKAMLAYYIKKMLRLSQDTSLTRAFGLRK
jgi:hypothetical protein